MPGIASIESQTRPNLEKTLLELGLSDGSSILVADQTTPNALVFKLRMAAPPDQDVDMI